MAKEYLNGKQSKESFKGNLYKGVLITVYMVGSANNVALAEADLNLSQVTVNCKLKRELPNKGILDHDIITGNLGLLAPAAAFDCALFGFFDPLNTSQTGFTILQTQTAGLPNIVSKSIYLPFGGNVDVTELGEIIMGLNVGAQTFLGNASTTASYLEVDLLEGDAPESFLPSVTCDIIEPNQVSPIFSGTGIISRLTFVNIDKTTSKLSDMVLTGCSMSTDAFQKDLSYYELLTLRAIQFEGEGQEDRAQTFDLIPFKDGKYYTKVKVTPTLTTANVNASKNAYVCWGGIPSASSIAMNKRRTKVKSANHAQTFAQAGMDYKRIYGG